MQTISGAELKRMILSAAASIEIHKQDLNELNVFPVPDGDTGTNMSMTIHAAANDLRGVDGSELYAVAKTAASATLRGARGNSGVILSLLFKGLKRALKGHDSCDGILWAQALQEGVDAAYKAVMKPAEGTILTVSRLAAAKAANNQTGYYTVYNKTGETVKELSLTINVTGEKTVVAMDVPADAVKVIAFTVSGDVDPHHALTLAFTTESGYTAAMETLGVETAPVTLLAAEAMTGATPISFSAPKAE